jgi:hypothetical protein
MKTAGADSVDEQGWELRGWVKEKLKWEKRGWITWISLAVDLRGRAGWIETEIGKLKWMYCNVVWRIYIWCSRIDLARMIKPTTTFGALHNRLSGFLWWTGIRQSIRIMSSVINREESTKYVLCGGKLMWSEKGKYWGASSIGMRSGRIVDEKSPVFVDEI